MKRKNQTNFTTEEILEFIRKHKKLTHQRYGVIKIGVFGSRVKGNEKIESDIDILIEMEKDKKNLHNFLEFKRFLGKNLGIQVDLGTESALKPMVKETIKDEIIYV